MIGDKLARRPLSNLHWTVANHLNGRAIVTPGQPHSTPSSRSHSLHSGSSCALYGTPGGVKKGEMNRMLEPNGLVHRIEKLERENKRLKLIAMFVAVCACAVVLVGAAKPSRTIEAEKFVLLDSHGRVKLTIGTPATAGGAFDTNPDDAVIWITGDNGADRAMLSKDGLLF